MRKSLAALILLATLAVIPHAFAGTGTIIAGLPPPIIVPPILYAGTPMPHAVDVATPTFQNLAAVVSEEAAGYTMANIANFEYRFTFDGTAWMEVQDLQTRLGYRWRSAAPSPGYETLGPSGWQTADESLMKTASCVLPAFNLALGTWNLNIKLPQLARFGTWLLVLNVTDKQGNYGVYSTPFDVNLWYSFQIPATVSFNTLIGLTTYQPASNMPFVITYGSNAISKILLATTTPTSGAYTIPTTNLFVGDQADLFAPGAVIIQLSSTQTVTWLQNLPSIESTTTPAYWFVRVPAETHAGTYTFTYTWSLVPQ